MNGFTDIHTHILPGVDDGAQGMPEALRLLRMAWDNGTRTVILTPHYRGKYKENTPAWLQENLLLLKGMAGIEFPDMRLYLGNEIAYEADAPEALFTKRVLTLNGSRYALLEFRTNSLRSQITAGVSETVRNGFVPIVAHVERYDVSRKDLTLTEELLEMGALLQLNADSILGTNGYGVKRFCHKLLKERAVQFVASDAHDSKHRPPLLRECFLHVRKKYGMDYAEALFYGNAQAVIENRNI